MTMMETAWRAVREASRLCRQISEQAGGIRSLIKDDRSPVTVADFASQAIVIRRLRQAFGDDVRIVAEEGADDLRDPQNAALLECLVGALSKVWPDVDAEQLLSTLDGGGDSGGEGCFWTLDPIDGTRGFLRGGQYAVSLGMIEDGRPRLGVLGCPHLSRDPDSPFDRADGEGTIYFGERGSGVKRLSVAGDEIDAVDLEPHGKLGSVLRIAESVEAAHSNQDTVSAVIERLGLPSERLRLDSQAKYAVVGRGQAHAYLRMPTDPKRKEKIWDHAAGAFLAGEAGCIVTDMHGGPLDFSRGSTLCANRGIVCAHREIHSRIIDAIDGL